MYVLQPVLPLEGIPQPEYRTVPEHPAERRARFFSKTMQHGECLVWTRAISNGYGRFWYYDHETDSQRVVRAHRFAWECEQAPATLIDPDLVLMHECDNRVCVRVGPGHVMLGTQAENVRHSDSIGRRRGRRAVLTESPQTTSTRLRASLIGAPVPGECAPVDDELTLF